MDCPLCFSHKKVIHFKSQNRVYYRCEICELIYLDSKCYLNADEEKAHYDCHENNLEDPNYRQYLKQFIDPLNEFLNKETSGLDFGCGRAPLLAKMCEELGHKMSYYDPFFYPDQSAIDKTYDFIIAVEVLEHLHRPKETLDQILSQLAQDGILSFVTELYSEKTDFEGWYYKNDPTHVIFFSEKTFSWLESEFPLECVYREKRQRIFKKLV
ncbi:MAG: class I SAM-dependent methyltransferase [Bacteriovoracaceae bacterium]